MRYWVLEPESPGSLGEDAIVDASVWPPAVSVLQCTFDCWPTDDLLFVWPCYLVGQSISDRMRGPALTGVEIAGASVAATSDLILYGGEDRLPPYQWLRIRGVAGIHDAGLTPAGDLVVSDRTMDVLRSGSLEQCLITEYLPVPEG